MNPDRAVMNYEEFTTKGVINNTGVVTGFNRSSDNRSLNLFSTSMEDYEELPCIKQPKSIRNPMSNRITEKRRRDHMNKCLADLRNLIPTDCIKQGQGRIEKTEIINMAIQHIKNLTKEVSRHGDESISQLAKEDQYRNADEEQYVPSVKVIQPVCPESKDFFGDTTLATMQWSHEGKSHSSLSKNRSTETSDLIKSAIKSFENAHEMTLEHLKRDQRQWPLLSTKYDSPMDEDSGLSSGSESVADTNKSSVYKFKHNITKRFYRDEKESRDRSDRSSRYEKRMFGNARSQCTSSSGSSRYTNSDSFYIEKTKISDLLAGFVLHPSGTHYLPLSIHLSDMPNNFFSEAQQDSRLYHPIHIQADFSGKKCQPFRTENSVSAEAANRCN